MKKIISVGLSVLLVSGCATLKEPQISGTDKANRYVDLSFNYNFLEKPETNWAKGLLLAAQQCQQWGYQKPQTESEAQDECVSQSERGNCLKHQVNKRYQCAMSPEQAAQIQEEHQVKEAKAKQEQINFAKQYPYIAEITCTVRGSAGYVIGCFEDDGIKTSLEVRTGNRYAHLQGFEVVMPTLIDKIGKIVNNAKLIVYLDTTFSIKAQNVDAKNMGYKLNISIKNTANGKTIYEKSAGKYEPIFIQN